MQVIRKNASEGHIATFQLESRIKNKSEYLVGYTNDFKNKKIEISIYQNEKRENRKQPYLIIYDSENNQIGEMGEDGGKITIDNKQYLCELHKFDDFFALYVIMYDKAIASKNLYYKDRKEDGELLGEREKFVGEGEYRHVEYY